ncbi:HNH domain-containing protein [Pseudomonas sp. IT-P171]|uniref:HNH endonuclease n=1 Tax=Pseudomonas sp. IT-P171 TaxID=3026453 RepID=UPI0039E03B46
MIKITKSPEPAQLAIERNKASGTYRHTDIVAVIKKDFYNRCYLCEDNPQSINIEHLIPHRDVRELIFNWENLFWSCSHCNNIKLAKYDNILDCTTLADIENVLAYHFEPFPTEDVHIEIMPPYNGEPQAQQTRALLQDVFNGTTTLKSIESNGLRKLITTELINLQGLLRDLDNENKSDEEIADIKLKLTSALSPKSLFASFKRGKVKRMPNLVTHLKTHIPALQL